jgi:hypothetical protein
VAHSYFHRQAHKLAAFLPSFYTQLGRIHRTVRTIRAHPGASSQPSSPTRDCCMRPSYGGRARSVPLAPPRREQPARSQVRRLIARPCGRFSRLRSLRTTPRSPCPRSRACSPHGTLSTLTRSSVRKTDRHGVDAERAESTGSPVLATWSSEGHAAGQLGRDVLPRRKRARELSGMPAARVVCTQVALDVRGL